MCVCRGREEGEGEGGGGGGVRRDLLPRNCTFWMEITIFSLSRHSVQTRLLEKVGKMAWGRPRTRDRLNVISTCVMYTVD